MAYRKVFPQLIGARGQLAALGGQRQRCFFCKGRDGQQGHQHCQRQQATQDSFFFMPHLSFSVFPILSRECLTPSAAIAECSQRGVPGNRAATHRELRAVTAQTHAAAMNNSIARSSAAGNGAAGIGILVGHNPSILANRIGRIAGSPGTVLMINDLCGKYPIAVHAIGQRVHRHFHRSAKLTGGCCRFAIVPKDR